MSSMIDTVTDPVYNPKVHALKSFGEALKKDYKTETGKLEDANKGSVDAIDQALLKDKSFNSSLDTDAVKKLNHHGAMLDFIQQNEALKGRYESLANNPEAQHQFVAYVKADIHLRLHRDAAVHALGGDDRAQNMVDAYADPINNIGTNTPDKLHDLHGHTLGHMAHNVISTTKTVDDGLPKLTHLAADAKAAADAKTKPDAPAPAPTTPKPPENLLTGTPFDPKAKPVIAPHPTKDYSGQTELSAIETQVQDALKGGAKTKAAQGEIQKSLGIALDGSGKNAIEIEERAAVGNMQAKFLKGDVDTLNKLSDTLAKAGIGKAHHIEAVGSPTGGKPAPAGGQVQGH